VSRPRASVPKLRAGAEFGGLAPRQVWALVQKIAEAVGLPSDHAEPLQVIHYTEGQQYRKHWDAYDLHTERGKRILDTTGNRLVTALGYINAPLGGGGTELPNLKLTVPAEAGRLLIFHDCYPGTNAKVRKTPSWPRSWANFSLL
jgi:prolyl 4-hydroxylase